MESLRDFGPVEFLLARLRGQGRFWHRTSLSSLVAILRHGAIVPNTGQFAGTSSQSERSYGRHMKAVSLFDFDKADATTVLNQAWGNLSIQGAHSVVLIGINRNLIDPTKLQLPDEIRKEVFRLSISGHSSGLTHIPEIEILHFGEVPVATFCGFFLTDGVRRYSETPVGDGAATTLLALSEEWQRDDRKLTMERRARGEYSDAEIMTEIVLKSYTR